MTFVCVCGFGATVTHLVGILGTFLFTHPRTSTLRDSRRCCLLTGRWYKVVHARMSPVHVMTVRDSVQCPVWTYVSCWCTPRLAQGAKYFWPQRLRAKRPGTLELDKGTSWCQTCKAALFRPNAPWVVIMGADQVWETELSDKPSCTGEWWMD